MLPVWNAHQETCGGNIDGDGGDESKNKVAKVEKNIFNNQQGLEVGMEDSGGVAWMGGHHNQRQWCTQYVIPEQRPPHPMIRKLLYGNHWWHCIPSYCSWGCQQLPVAGLHSSHWHLIAAMNNGNSGALMAAQSNVGQSTVAFDGGNG